ncbi:uncharacterized protein VTP21DRAFT_501 [Calcarisporiella thermophila]|uniref:uncharacterized protein n=1 Tax=Calcarisporiella thermophila TaxID=911321 RepID=UPI003742877C
MKQGKYDSEEDGDDEHDLSPQATDRSKRRLPQDPAHYDTLQNRSLFSSEYRSRQLRPRTTRLKFTEDITDKDFEAMIRAYNRSGETRHSKRLRESVGERKHNTSEDEGPLRKRKERWSNTSVNGPYSLRSRSMVRESESHSIRSTMGHTSNNPSPNNMAQTALYTEGRVTRNRARVCPELAPDFESKILSIGLSPDKSDHEAAQNLQNIARGRSHVDGQELDQDQKHENNSDIEEDQGDESSGNEEGHNLRHNRSNNFWSDDKNHVRDSTLRKSDRDSDEATGYQDDEEDQGKRKYYLRERQEVSYVLPQPQSPTNKSRKNSHSKLGNGYRLNGKRRDNMRHTSSRSGYAFSRFQNNNFTTPYDSGEDVNYGNNFKHVLGGDNDSRILPLNLRELQGTRERRLLPVNVSTEDPLAPNQKVDFTSVGGLDHHIKSLKEMVMLPLLYPEVYSRFQITPPRGVLFHGPPGTGKTLLARALASSCSTESQKVAFFMRKGADCLSKWVGEAERQLRILFEEAKAWQPSIIFFDEIDGLAPIRSSKHEQVHASIVSTLLALMDGLDSRGQVIVIGATNRIDSIDPALRRPGRFDREFYFPLPNETARRKIIEIVTRGWDPPVPETFITHLAKITKGCCGADIKALCTEAALRAIHRRYPQIYESPEKLLIDSNAIRVRQHDFLVSSKLIVPASARIAGSNSMPLPKFIEPLLLPALHELTKNLQRSLPNINEKDEEDNIASDDDMNNIDWDQTRSMHCLKELRTFKPRLLICGKPGMGQQYIGRAIIDFLEGFFVQSFDLASLLSDSLRTPEATCVQLFIEVKRQKPSVIFIPCLEKWRESISDALFNTFTTLLEDIPPHDPILLLSTSSCTFEELPEDVQSWYKITSNSFFELKAPAESQRRVFFQHLIDDITRAPKEFESGSKRTLKEVKEVLPKAPPPPPRLPTEEEKRLLREHDEYIFRELRISLRTIVDELFKEKKYKEFSRPVDPELMPDYYNVVTQPMDLQTLREKINMHEYLTVADFLEDIDLMVYNTELYYDRYSPQVNRIKDMQDVAYSIVGRFNPELIRESEKSAARRRLENQKSNRKANDYSKLAIRRQAVPQQVRPQQQWERDVLPKRVSMRVRGISPSPVREIQPTSRANRRKSDREGEEASNDEASDKVVIPEKDPRNEIMPANAKHFDNATYIPNMERSKSEPLPSGRPIVNVRRASSHISRDVSPISITLPADSASMSTDNYEPGKKIELKGSSQDKQSTADAEGAEKNGANNIVAEANEELMTEGPTVDSDTLPLSNQIGASPSPFSQLPAQTTEIEDQMQTMELDQQESTLPTPVLRVEEEEVQRFSNWIVAETKSFSIDELDELRSLLYSKLWDHRMEWDKTALLEDLFETTREFLAKH